MFLKCAPSHSFSFSPAFGYALLILCAEIEIPLVCLKMLFVMTGETNCSLAENVILSSFCLPLFLSFYLYFAFVHFYCFPQQRQQNSPFTLAFALSQEQQQQLQTVHILISALLLPVCYIGLFKSKFPLESACEMQSQRVRCANLTNFSDKSQQEREKFAFLLLHAVCMFQI